MPEPTATPLSRTIKLQLAGQPAVKNRWGSGHINPTHAVITYLGNQRTAHLYGTWIREDGEQTDAPVDQLYRHDDTWPDWLTNLADKHAPTVAQSAAAPDAADAIVTALTERAKELSALAEEEMRPSLEDRAQEWHEAANIARRAAAKARQNGAQR